jgi:hypothetical protein
MGYVMGDMFFDSRQEQEVFLTAKTSSPALGPIDPPMHASLPGIKRHGPRLTTSFVVVPKLRMGGDVPPTPYASLWRTKGQIYVTFTFHSPLYFNTHNSPEDIGANWGGGEQGGKISLQYFVQ